MRCAYPGSSRISAMATSSTPPAEAPTVTLTALPPVPSPCGSPTSAGRPAPIPFSLPRSTRSSPAPSSPSRRTPTSYIPAGARSWACTDRFWRRPGLSPAWQGFFLGLSSTPDYHIIGEHFGLCLVSMDQVQRLACQQSAICHLRPILVHGGQWG